ncbi:Hypothetical predicted protein [Olea europaea subsp. europaea]|uniref:Uncharacterized protein n=1 Tax=Olea europaea subsp. europaea TaxID=158383 RepID=A0A8S0QHI3_OLEEU|nr:Hypothetical predicted protein [Olea europaea subsp. europaea]
MGGGGHNGGAEKFSKSLGSVGLDCICETFATQIFKQNNFSSFICLLNNFTMEAEETTQLMIVNISLKIRVTPRHKQMDF